jgi:hypothetical protein
MRFMSLVALIVLTLFSVNTAFAVSPHFVGGGPTFTDEGTTLNAVGSVAGLGNEDLTVVLDATGIASVECVNPGGNRAPGQDTSVDVSGEVTDIEVKNGRAFFNVSTNEPVVTGAEACPNPQWTAVVTDVAFSDATLTFFQGGEQVLQESFEV